MNPIPFAKQQTPVRRMTLAESIQKANADFEIQKAEIQNPSIPSDPNIIKAPIEQESIIEENDIKPNIEKKLK